MGNTNTIWDKVFFGFGIIVFISGIMLALEGNYVSGISGSIVGVWLVAMNMKKMKASNSEVEN